MTAPRAEPALIAELLPSYELVEQIGRGGFGFVFSARHRALGRWVAIKQLAHSFVADPALRGRFGREARVLAELDHPHIVQVYDYVEDDRACLLVMELIEGPSVSDRFLAGGLTTADAFAVAIGAAAALHYAHGRSVLHRDVKPQNIMVADAGTVKVVDFGLAKVVGGNESLATLPGQVLGSPAYMAPEQVTGDPLGPSTDVYALATALYEILAGCLPFDVESNAMALLGARVLREPRPLRDVASVHPAVVEVVMRAIATSPADRYLTAEAFAVALAGAATDQLGPGWLTTTDIRLQVAGPVDDALAAARARPPATTPAPALLVAGPASAAAPRLALDAPLDSEAFRDARPVFEVLEAHLEAARTGILDGPPRPLAGPARRVDGPVPTRRTPTARLTITEPGRSPRQVQVVASTDVGRRCDGIELVDAEVSRRHFRLVLDAGGLVVEDLGSTNGTLVNGAPITSPTPIRAGARIVAGATELHVDEVG